MNNKDIIIKTIQIIENNLKENLSVFELSNKAGYSLYHFIRLFQGITGYSPKEYMLKRKLTEAAKQIISTNKKIIEIAFDYKFNDHETFTRAFKKIFGMNPNEIRKKNFTSEMELFNKSFLNENNKIINTTFLNPEIVNLDSFYLIGLSVLIQNNYKIITDLWNKFSININKISNRIIPEEFCQFSFWSDEYEMDGFFCMASIKVKDLKEININLVGKIVPKNKYLKFIHKGKSRQIINTYKFIYEKWLPDSKIKLTLPYNLELYSDKFIGTDNDNSEIEIYIPIEN